MKKSVLLGLIVVLAVSCSGKRVQQPIPAEASKPKVYSNVEQRLQKHGYPKLANQIQGCCDRRRMGTLMDQLHFYDLAVVDAEVVYGLPEYLGSDGILRSRNPNLVLLTYFSAGDVNPYYRRPVQQEFIQSMKDSWYLHDIHGKQVPLYQLSNSSWTIAQNPWSPVNEFLPRYMNDKVIQTGLVDGVFYDWAITYVSWIAHRQNREAELDIDNDGKADSDDKIDELWVNGFKKMLQNSREVFPPGMLILGNGGWNTGPQYANALNGIMIEHFTGGETTDSDLFGWRALMRTYAYYEQKSAAPHVSLIMANDDSERNFEHMRFSLCSALLMDGYFCFTNTNLIGAYQSSRWYDEFSVNVRTGEAGKNPEWKHYLGNPVSKAFDTSDSKRILEKAVEHISGHAETRVWRRDFENGIVLVNPGINEQKVELHGTFRKIRGQIDPEFNDGATVTSVTLPARTGIILLNTSGKSAQ